jgi:hypothetical protein
VVISCSAADTFEHTNEPPGTGKPEAVDGLTDVHSTQAIMQAPKSFEGANLRSFQLSRTLSNGRRVM